MLNQNTTMSNHLVMKLSNFLALKQSKLTYCRGWIAYIVHASYVPLRFGAEKVDLA